MLLFLIVFNCYQHYLNQHTDLEDLKQVPKCQLQEAAEYGAVRRIDQYKAGQSLAAVVLCWAYRPCS